ncbi:poly-beta-1,6-N-acetyl-D-glucosamine synthase [Crenothrix polyspora]|jgi:poly-beta-1,6-N-acetyl-D-glucosamine synthase|uniref:Poly-beta-1,6-N-acetyl-D-glucosamine synthase n=1 Tax=Crenothrix polyspora TaxID=360316 RepID=A0A1R4H5F1_9GAMM|nr:poly-beta-1,6-N-acetyl-D-glucosamine synthase [Crenothrix polyspora]SJM91396.1 putative glycosyl transferase associated with biofilm formation [Crenothrix polyspora]
MKLYESVIDATLASKWSDFFSALWRAFLNHSDSIGNAIFHPSTASVTSIFRFLMDFAFYYPLLMAYMWIIGGLIYYYRWERKENNNSVEKLELTEYPPVSILIPCHNEGYDILETIEFLLQQDYPDFEIIAINDGSTDNTLEVLLSLATKHERVRVINLEQNQGKAMGLNTAALFSKNEFLICIDGDALLDPGATRLIMQHFHSGTRVAAVTGNPRIRTRSTLLGKIQVGEFSAIIGLIKRCQQIYGRIFTVSGVVCGFRKAALHRVGYWSTDMITEDIDITCKLQLDHWDIRYEPRALCWILMPETFKGLWSQRKRWSQGGSEVLLKHFRNMLTWKSRRMIPIYLEYMISVFWAYVMMMFFILWVISLFTKLPDGVMVPGMYPTWGGMLLGLTCLLQFAVSLVIDSRYEKGMGKEYYWIIWYPIIYWAVNVLVAVTGLYLAVRKTFFAKGKKKRAVWTSPDRGNR